MGFLYMFILDNNIEKENLFEGTDMFLKTLIYKIARAKLNNYIILCFKSAAGLPLHTVVAFQVDFLPVT